MTKKITNSDNVEKAIPSKKELTKYTKLSSTFSDVARACNIDVKTLFRDLENFYNENKSIFALAKISKLSETVYNFDTVVMTPMFETSFKFLEEFNNDLDKTLNLTSNKLFSFLLVFKAENNDAFLFQIKDLNFKKQYTKDSLTSIFQEYNKTNQNLYKQNIELQEKVSSVIDQLINEREEFQQTRLQEKEERKKDRDMMKKMLSAMQDLNNSNVVERTKFNNNFQNSFQAMENKFEMFLNTLDVVVTNLENLSSDDVQ